MYSIGRFSFALLSFISVFASLCAAADAPLWEPGKVVAVEQVSLPAKEPDPSCRSVPKGAVPPPRCRPSYLRAVRFWNVTVDVGNKRFVVRPVPPPGSLYLLSQGGTEYVDPQLTAPSAVEVAIISTKSVRLKADGGKEIFAMVESQKLLSTPEVPPKVDPPPPPRPQAIAPATSTSKVVLLENSDFVELEVQEIKSQDIGDGAVLYSFTGDSSPARVGSSTPVFLVTADDAAGGNVELSRLQVGQGTRQMAYSLTKNRSASSIPITVAQVSATLRKVNVQEPLSPGQYVVLLENSNRGFLFAVR